MDKLNLQLFASEDTKSEETQTEETQSTETTKDEKEFDINSILNNPEFVKYMESHADKRVSSALSKKEKEYQAQLEQERKKASMTQEELQADKERELAEREQTLKQYELKISKLDYFKEKNYDIDLLDFVVGNDDESIKTNSDNLVATINKVVEKAVQERLKSSAYTPPNHGDNKGKSIKKEDFNKMGYQERAKLAKENKELYDQLSK